MVMAFQGFMSSFMQPANKLISAGQSLQEMITQMERLDDVMSYPTDPYLEERGKTSGYQKLTGAIEMKDIVFGYAPLGDPLITDFSLSVKPGQKIALVGRSGFPARRTGCSPSGSTCTRGAQTSSLIRRRW